METYTSVDNMETFDALDETMEDYPLEALELTKPVTMKEIRNTSWDISTTELYGPTERVQELRSPILTTDYCAGGWMRRHFR